MKTSRSVRNLPLIILAGLCVPVLSHATASQMVEWGDTRQAMPAGLTNVMAVAAGDLESLALRDDGTVVRWGYYGGSVPAGLSNVVAIAGGAQHDLALASNGTVVAWGIGIATNVPAGLSNVVAIAAGSSHSLVLNKNGTVIAWGDNSKGQTNVPAGLSNVVAMAAGFRHSLALKADGTAVAWGTGPETNVPAGLSNIVAIAAGGDKGGGHSLALKQDGTVAAWGTGPGTNVPAGLSNVVAVVAGAAHSLALKNYGTVVGWGYDNYGQAETAGLSNVVAIVAGGYHSLVLKRDGLFVMGQPRSQTAYAGDQIVFNVMAVGTQPLSYQWRFNGTNIPGATNALLMFTNVQPAQAGDYQAAISNLFGTATSAVARLTIPFDHSLGYALNSTNLVWESFMSTNKAPSWFAQTRETHDGAVAAQSGPIVDSQRSYLIASLTGPGTLTFWWKVSSEAGHDLLSFYLDSATVPLASISGQTEWWQQTFAIPAGTHVARWIYAKDASVSFGQDAGWVDQVVFPSFLPTIVGQPFDQTASMGASVMFPAIADGMAPLNCQWLKNGTNLPGATSQYLMLTNVTRRDSATYTLRVTNAVGATLSSNATLKVNVPQRLSAAVLLPDGSFSLTSGDADGSLLQPGDLAGFEVQAATNLTDWVTLTNALTLTNGSLRLLDPEAATLPRRFYRILEH